LHEAPGPRRAWHALPSHQKVEAQKLSPVALFSRQLLWHVAESLHAKLFGHGAVVGVCEQLPLPSQVVSVVSVEPEHVGELVHALPWG
jgi:hypothetical protein